MSPAASGPPSRNGAATSDGAEPSGTRLWDAHAAWWKATFTDGADIEYEGEIIPLLEAELAGCRRILDIGCGEGQVARRLGAASTGPFVTGLDPSSAQLANAGAAGAPAYVQGAGEDLPFAAGAFDGAFCCLSIEHADDPDAVLAEAARVLAPGGTLLLLINHPMYQGPQSGFIDDQILGEQYWRVGPYLVEQVTVEQVDAGVAIPFAHRPLSRYVNPLALRDFVMTKMLEPPPLPAFLADSVAPDLEAAIPRLLAMRFEHRPPLRAARARRTAAKGRARARS